MTHIKSITLFIFSFSVVYCSGQVLDSIKVEQRVGTVFLHNGEQLNPRQMEKIMQGNADAMTEMRLAKRNYNLTMLFGAAGGLLVGFPLGQSASSDVPLNIEMVLSGVGLILVAIPFSINYNLRAKKATSIYNNGLTTSSVYRLEPYTIVRVGSIGFGIIF